MARLCCFYNELHPRAEAGLLRWAPAAGLRVEWVDTSASQHEYAAQLAKRWTGEQDLIVVEQDKELHSLCLPALLTCDAPWCSFTCWLYPEPHTTLGIGAFGVTKFSVAVQRLVPVADFAGDRQKGIDRRFGDLLRTRHGIGCCLHGHVVHHHAYEPRPAPVVEHARQLRAARILPPAAYPDPPGPGLLPGMDPPAAG